MGLIHKDAVIVKVTLTGAQFVAGAIAAPYFVEGFMRRSQVSDMMTVGHVDAEPTGWMVLLDNALEKPVAIVRRKHIVAVEIE